MDVQQLPGAWSPRPGAMDVRRRADANLPLIASANGGDNGGGHGVASMASRMGDSMESGDDDDDDEDQDKEGGGGAAVAVADAEAFAETWRAHMTGGHDGGDPMREGGGSGGGGGDGLEPSSAELLMSSGGGESGDDGMGEAGEGQDGLDDARGKQLIAGVALDFDEQYFNCWGGEGQGGAAGTLGYRIVPNERWSVSEIDGGAEGGGAAEPMVWCNDSVVTALDFSETGDFLASGDAGGRVKLFRRTTRDDEMQHTMYDDFVSHLPGIDYLSSMPISETISVMRWCPPQAGSQLLLAANEANIKLWRVRGDAVEAAGALQHAVGGAHAVQPPAAAAAGADGVPVLPRLALSQHARRGRLRVKPVKDFFRAHLYGIHSLSMCSDGESFLSSDDLRINLWHMGHPTSALNVVDMKPANGDPPSHSELLTSAAFHPKHCNLFLRGTASGGVHISDLRSSATSQDGDAAALGSTVRRTANALDGSPWGFDWSLAVQDAKFMGDDGRYILVRDMHTIKIWDTHMHSTAPFKTISLREAAATGSPSAMDQGSPRGGELEMSFDRHRCAASADGYSVLTGFTSSQSRPMSSSTFAVLDWEGNLTQLEGPGGVERQGGWEDAEEENWVTEVAWHSSENIVATSAQNLLYVWEGGEGGAVGGQPEYD